MAISEKKWIIRIFSLIVQEITRNNKLSNSKTSNVDYKQDLIHFFYF